MASGTAATPVTTTEDGKGRSENHHDQARYQDDDEASSAVEFAPIRLVDLLPTILCPFYSNNPPEGNNQTAARRQQDLQQQQAQWDLFVQLMSQPLVPGEDDDNYDYEDVDRMMTTMMNGNDDTNDVVVEVPSYHPANQSG